MNRVNLLPPEILEQEAMRERTRRFLIVSAVVLAIFAVVFLTILSMTLVVKGQIASIKIQRMEVQKRAAGYGVYTRLQNQLESTNNLVKQLLSGSADWKLLTDYIQASVPPGLWLTEMTLTGSSVTIKGTAYGPGVVGTWVDKLGAIPAFKSVVLKNLNEQTENTTGSGGQESVTTFEVNITFDRSAVKLKTGQEEV